MSPPLALPCVKIWVITKPIWLRSSPANPAASVTSFMKRPMSLVPAPMAWTAIPNAASNEYGVPVTESTTILTLSATSLADMPNAFSLPLAASIFSSRSKPLVRAKPIPATPTPAAAVNPADSVFPASIPRALRAPPPDKSLCQRAITPPNPTLPAPSAKLFPNWAPACLARNPVTTPLPMT